MRPARGLLFPARMLLVMGFLILTFGSPLFAASANGDDEHLRQKAGWLIDKGLKARAAGLIDEAVVAFQGAHEMYPANVRALVLWGETLCHAGTYRRAFDILAKIPVQSLPSSGQSQVHLLNARIHFASGNREGARQALESALSADPTNDMVKARLSMLLELLGDHRRAGQMIESMRDCWQLPLHEHFGVMLLECAQLRPVRALQHCSDMTLRLQRAAYVEGETPLSIEIWQIFPLLLLVYFPGSSSLTVNAAWWLLFLGAIAGLARMLRTPGNRDQDATFIVVGFFHMLVIRWFAGNDIHHAILGEDAFVADAGWVFPRHITGMQMVSASLFPIFSLFRTLPNAFQPQRRELYAIWFFTFWLMLGILFFQSNMSFITRFPGLALCMAATLLAAGNLPLSRYLLFKASLLFGFKVPIDVSGTAGSGGAGFTDLKIQEARILACLEREEFKQVIGEAQAILNQGRNAFPSLWQAVLRARIETEDYFLARSGIQEYLEAFAPSATRDGGLLLAAYYKSLTSDHPGAFQIVDGISVSRTSLFSRDQKAISLLVQGRFQLSIRSHVQAHMDFAKGVEMADNPLLRARLLLDLCHLDFRMNRPEGIAKRVELARGKPGGPKSRALLIVMEAILAEALNEREKALELAKKACAAFPHNGPALGWLGTLLIRRKQYREAEGLLEKMVAGSEEAHVLMQATTTRSADGETEDV